MAGEIQRYSWPAQETIDMREAEDKLRELQRNGSVCAAHIFAQNAEMIVFTGMPKNVNIHIVEFCGHYLQSRVLETPCAMLGAASVLSKDIAIWFPLSPASRRKRTAIQLTCFAFSSGQLQYSFLGPGT
jgi:hypothetical protein